MVYQSYFQIAIPDAKYNEMDNEDSDNSQQATTDQEFDKCETPKKKLNSSLQSKGVRLLTLYMQLLNM